MDPKDFSWTEDQQVTVINPTSESFKFKVHAKEYQVGAGKSAKMPGYIAWVYVYGMASQLCQEDKEFMRWNEEGFRQTYYEKVVSGVDPVMQDIQVEEQPLVTTLDEPEEQSDVAPASIPSATDVADSLAAEEDEQEPELTPQVAPMKPKVINGQKSASRA